ncbi:MAG: protein kinase [Acidobacteria bacterium]|nr:protein kinase [Acidobacteriota bacterium]
MLAGEKLGRYKINRKIGAGGMGEVFLAHDDQLDRNVALKVLLPEFSNDEQRVTRFKFEARAVSALNHPGIITIHEIVEEDGRLFLATEFVDGATLRRRMEAGDLTLLESISIAEQVADALTAAHQANIVHRDIKPENIMIRHDGYAKVLDFGLAKPKILKDSGNEDETIQMVKTLPGLVMGSVRYMSPDQARGKETDERTDIWSLGVVIYEMLTGENPFEGETISDSLAALIHKEPELSDEIPEDLARILRKSMDKNLETRYQHMSELARDLKALRLDLERGSVKLADAGFIKTSKLPKQDTSENKTLIHSTLSADNTSAYHSGNENKTRINTISHNRNLWFLPVVLVTAAAVLAVSAWYYLPSLTRTSDVSFTSVAVSRLTDDGNAHAAAVSPDGKFAAYVNTQDGRPKLFVRQISTGSNVEVVPATNKAFLQPTFSTDGEFIYYVLVDNGVGTLYRVSTLGGDSTEIAVDVDSSVTFSPDGSKLAFYRHDANRGGDTVMVASNLGKDLTPFVSSSDLGFDAITDVVWTNDPDKILLAGNRNDGDRPQRIKLVLVDRNTKQAVNTPDFDIINSGGWESIRSIRWLKNDSGIVFVGQKNLDQSRQIWHYSLVAHKLSSVTTDTSDYASLSVSEDGNTIVSDKVDRISGLSIFSPQTKEIKQVLPESKNFMGHLGVSQIEDGKILYSKLSGDEVNIFLMDEDGNNERMLTKGGKFNIQSSMTSDGRYIVFSSNRSGSYSIWRMDPDGSNPKQLTRAANVKDVFPRSANSGNSVFFMRQNNDGGKGQLMKVSIDGGGETPLIPENELSVGMIRVSPDGKSLAYSTFFYDADAKELRPSLRIASIEGDTFVRETAKFDIDFGRVFDWAPDGKSITFERRDVVDNLFKLPLESKKESPITDFNAGNIINFTWAKDGKRIFLVRGIVNSDLVLIKDSSEA